MYNCRRIGLPAKALRPVKKSQEIVQQAKSTRISNPEIFISLIYFYFLDNTTHVNKVLEREAGSKLIYINAPPTSIVTSFSIN